MSKSIDGTPADAKWTSADESEFQHALERRRSVMRARMSEVADVANRFSHGNAEVIAHLALWLIKDAKAIRDALKPFDDGCREAKFSGNAGNSPDVSALVDHIMRSAGYDA